MPEDIIRIMPTCVPESAQDTQVAIHAASAFAPGIHLDIDDGVFTSEVSWPFAKKGERVGELPVFDIPVDNFVIQAHLMVSDVRDIGDRLLHAGVDSIIAHVEAIGDDVDTLGGWSLIGAREIGIAILLDTPIEKLEPLLPFCDFIHVLSVASIGAQGAAFDDRAYERVAELRARFPSHPISLDGGVSLDNIARLVQVGARRFSVGSAIARRPDLARAYQELKTAAEGALQ